MSLSTLWAGYGYRLRRRRNSQRGFFLLEALVLSFLVLACGALASYLHAHGAIPWRGGETSPERNGMRFEISSSVSPNPETDTLASVETRVRWQIGTRRREEIYRKLVAYHE